MSGSSIFGVGLADLREVSAGMGTFSGARLVTLEDGQERGVRIIEMRSGGGLDLDIVVDRSGDIGRLAFEGQTLSWHPTAGLRAPWLMDQEGDRGQNFLRGFGGFLNTCGLDHIRQPETDRVERANQDNLVEVDFPLHGKGTHQPSVIRGYGLVDDVEDPYVFCETEFTQAMSFVSALRLRRRIEMPVGSQVCTIHDVVRNIGNTPSTHMQLYHFNLGFPLVAPETLINMSGDSAVWMSEDHAPLAPFPRPKTDSPNVISVFRHRNETARVSVQNPNSGLHLQLEYPSKNLPYCQLLRMTERGIYGIGLEPCTTGSRSRQAAREQGEMVVLQPDEERQYHLKLKITKCGKTGRLDKL